MSAIWGMVDFQKKSGNEDLAERMQKPYDTYKIDVYKHHVTENAVFGYGGQYFTIESEKEIQPIVSEEEKLLFVSDVVLDNREELFALLDINPEVKSEIADGTLMYEILRKYGKQSFSMFLGSYAFVYYDKNKEEVLLVTDSVGSRTLYYNFEHGKLYFSTLIKPILAEKEGEIWWNYRFLSDYLALDNLATSTEAEETPYMNIFKVAPYQVVYIKEQGIVKEDYWKLPIKVKRFKKSDSDIKKEFIELFDRCVSDAMRSSGKTGILLSGGLDSTSVACFAAPKLKKKGEQLYSYTSIPEKGFVSKERSYYSTNEQKLVETTRDYLGNVVSTFFELSGVNGFDGAEAFMKQFEVPNKSLQNMRWLYGLSEKAAEDGCRILFGGDFGNVTISYGNFLTYCYSLMGSVHFIEVMKEIKAFGKKYHCRRKRIIFSMLSNVITNSLINKFKKRDMFEHIYLNPKLIRKYNIKKRFIAGNNMGSKNTYTNHSVRPYLLNKEVLSEIGEIETHLSLSTGVLQRDPTRDKRLIEFCMRLPDNQYVYRGTERRLVREYLESYLPKEIITAKKKGLQSADFIDRISKNWSNIYRECCAILETEAADKLLDLPKIKDKLDTYQKKLATNDNFEVMKLLYSILLVRYVST